jgi:hypothetical protein
VEVRAGKQRSDAVMRAGSTECQVDTDCVELDTRLSCVADCGSIAIVPAGAAPTLQQDVTRIEQQFCQSFTDRSCPGPMPPPCTPSESGYILMPICFNNHCDIARLLP